MRSPFGLFSLLYHLVGGFDIGCYRCCGVRAKLYNRLNKGETAYMGLLDFVIDDIIEYR